MDFNFIPLAFGEVFSPTTAAYALAAIGLAVHFGFAGLLNFGQAGFMALGGYAFAVTTVIFGLPVWMGFLMVIAVSVVFALILGIPTLRLRADYLSIVTIAAAEIVRLSVKTPEFSDVTGGSEGINGAGRVFNEATNPLPDGRWGVGVLTYSSAQWWLIIVGWAMVAIACLLVWLLTRSPWGRVLRGIREDEDAVRSLGKNVYQYKMQALIIGGVIGGFGGFLFILPRSLQPDNYGTQMTFFLYTILLLGGAATVFGPVLGSIIFWVVLSLSDGVLSLLVSNGWLPIATTQQGPIRFIIVGVALMLLVIFRPQGILGKKKEALFSA
ncbi:branched-chain amino acid ABC transporter permease [Protaetiibacter mangrovi]|uniref:Branched-chain amino acid ABC transporter permease n=1 Tax=Protaetiibacter mangrovi TaxID=2970926 RepID=A0ABT1ZDC9_9MICO|nr:branched-chain amino acid ABC transporter permease [Protaetiibacter mangrovi]MCS0498700.1 branched-chain amino acid ABC transporter permease [Protaetiibacter mangrovi]TPX03455.1 branched-chain amino acid ABC transporter permease [Schumannella luteola]